MSSPESSTITTKIRTCDHCDDPIEPGKEQPLDVWTLCPECFAGACVHGDVSGYCSLHCICTGKCDLTC